MTTYTQRSDVGGRQETKTINALGARGLKVEPFGQALLSPDVREVLKTTQSLLRWLPDLVGWRPTKPRLFLVDAKGCMTPGTGNHAIELRVLLAARFTMLPVFYICDDLNALAADMVWPDGPVPLERTCCADCLARAKADPTGRELPRWCPEHVRRGGRGSGTPYALIRRVHCQPLDDFFGPVIT